jgi:hypothetical protein
MAASGRGALALVLSMLLSVVACGGGGGSGESTTEIPAADYFPLSVGSHWSYTELGLGQGAVVHVDRAAVVDGRSGAILRTTYSPVLGDWFVDGTNEGFYSVSAAGLTFVPVSGSSPIELLFGTSDVFRLPMHVGDSFVQYEATFNDVDDLDGDGRRERLSVRSTVKVIGLEDVTVPAGTFSGSLRLRNVITQKLTLSDNDRTVEVATTADDWFAPNVGLVRTVLETLSGSEVLERGERVLVAYRVGAASNDPTRPQILSVHPAQGAVGAPPARVDVQLSEPVDPDSGRAAFTVVDSSGQVHPGTVSGSGSTMTWRPTAPMSSGVYEARVSDELIDIAGNPVAASAVWQFDVDARGPQVLRTSPAADAMRVAIDSTIVVEFDEPLTINSLDTVRIMRAGGTTYGSPREVRVAGSTLTIIPGAPLERGVEYEIELRALGIRDAFGNPLAADARWRFGTDAGRFARAQPVFSRFDTTSAIGDVDGDGRLDIVGTLRVPPDSSGANGLVVRLQRPDGTLGVETDLGWRDTPSGDCPLGKPVVADFDGNGLPDIAAETACGISLLLQGSDGSFVAAPSLAPARDLRAADVDGDGRTDLIGFSDITSIRFWRQQAGGGLAAPIEIPTGLSLSVGFAGHLTLADLDGNGRVDIVFATTVGDYTRQQIVVLRQQLDGSFVSGGVVAARVSRLAVGDMNDDGRPDVVVAEGSNGNGVVGVLAQAADGSFGAPVYTAIADSPAQLALIDIDRDGRLDGVISHSSFGIGYLRRTPGGGFEAEQLYAAAPRDSSLSVGDLDGDGLADLLLQDSWVRQLPEPLAAAQASMRRPLRKPE